MSTNTANTAELILPFHDHNHFNHTRLTTPHAIAPVIYDSAEYFFSLPPPAEDKIASTFLCIPKATIVETTPDCAICKCHQISVLVRPCHRKRDAVRAYKRPRIGLVEGGHGGEVGEVFHEQCLMAVLSGDGEGMVEVGEKVKEVREWVKVMGWGTEMLDQAIERVMEMEGVEE